MELAKQNKEVFTMDAANLREYLYNYIGIKKSLAAFRAQRTAKEQQVEQAYRKQVRRLNGAYDQFVDAQLHQHQQRAEAARDRVNGWADHVTLPLHFISYWVIMFFIIFIATHGLNLNNFLSTIWTPLWQSFLWAAGLRIFRGWLEDGLRFVIGFLLDLVVLGAKQWDQAQANRRGVSTSNTGELFHYDEAAKEIKQNHQQAVAEVSAWQAPYYNNLCQQEKTYGAYIPEQVNNIGYLSYLHEQLYIGAADNWKEAVNLLTQKIHHAETVGTLKSLAGELAANTAKLTAYDKKIDRQFAELNEELETSFGVVDKRLDGLFEGYGYY